MAHSEEISREDPEIDALIERLQKVHLDRNDRIFNRNDMPLLVIYKPLFQLCCDIPPALKRGEQKLKAMAAISGIRDIDERARRLCEAFQFACRLVHLADRLVTEPRDLNRVHRKPYAVGVKLLKLGRIKDLTVFLDHSDAYLRAAAAICLANVFPERAEAVLNKIIEDEEGKPMTAAGQAANAGLLPLRYEREREALKREKTGKE